MGSYYGQLPIVGKNLEIYLNAKADQSYPGYGETWYDLSGNNRHTNRGGSQKPIWNNDKYWTFTGGVNGNNYTRFDIPVPDMDQVSFFLTYRSSQSSARIARMSTDDFNLTLANGTNIGGGAGNSYLDSYSTSNQPDSRTGWHYLGITFNGSHSKLYYDGELVNIGYYNRGTTNISGGVLRLGTRNDANSEHYIGDISVVQIYSRYLSEQEVLTNYQFLIKNKYLL